MIKHILALLILSIVVILFLPQFADGLHYVGEFHAWFTGKLLMIFSSNQIGKLVSHVLALLLIPIIIACIPGFLFWIFRRRELPYLAMVTWILWVILATIIALK